MLENWFSRRRPRWRVAVTRSALGGVLVAASAMLAAPPSQATTAGTPGAEAAAERAAGPHVVISHHAYTPATLTVQVGTTITWVNTDDEPHTVTSSARLFGSPGLDTDDVFSQTFSEPGTYVYFCTLHPLMTAEVIVK
jgi:plastocyanin